MSKVPQVQKVVTILSRVSQRGLQQLPRTPIRGPDKRFVAGGAFAPFYHVDEEQEVTETEGIAQPVLHLRRAAYPC